MWHGQLCSVQRVARKSRSRTHRRVGSMGEAVEEGVVGLPVDLVAQDGVSRVLEMNPDLVGSSGGRPCLDQRERTHPLEYGQLGLSGEAIWVHAPAQTDL